MARSFDEREDERAAAADDRAMRARGRREEGAHRTAYREGQDEGRRQSRGRRMGAFRRTSRPQVYSDPADDLDPDAGLQSTYELGFEDAVRAERRRAGGGLIDKARNSRPAWWVEDSAGFILGILAYSLLLAYLRGGPDAVKGWFKAKFLNQPYKGNLKGGGPASPLSPSSPSGPAGPSTIRITPQLRQITPAFPSSALVAARPDVVGVTAGMLPTLADALALTAPLAPDLIRGTG